MDAKKSGVYNFFPLDFLIYFSHFFSVMELDNVLIFVFVLFFLKNGYQPHFKITSYAGTGTENVHHSKNARGKKKRNVTKTGNPSPRTLEP
jgi:hypothetical protein